MPKSARHRPNCANLSCLCVNSSCQCEHSLARIRVLIGMYLKGPCSRETITITINGTRYAFAKLPDCSRKVGVVIHLNLSSQAHWSTFAEEC